MKKQMEPISVETKNNRIFITQEDYGQEESSICIAPDQVDTLINWLQKAKEEIEQKEE